MMDNRKNSLRNLILQLTIDAVCVFFSYWLAFVFRFLPDHRIPLTYSDSFRTSIPWITLICLAVFALFRFYNTMWEFASLDELLQIFYGTTAACLIVAVFGYTVFPNTLEDSYGMRIMRFPIPVYVMGWILTFFLVGVSRFVIRLNRRVKRKRLNGARETGEGAKRVMIVGAGEMGSLIIKDMKHAPQSKGIPVVAIDDDKKKRGTRIHGVKVVGGRESIAKMVERYNVDEIILAIATAKQADRKKLISICSKTGCRLKTIPALYEILQGSTDPLRVRDVNI